MLADSRRGVCGQDLTLLHRDRELAAIGEALTGLDAGRPRVVMISGARGAGKSALLWTAMAGHSGLVLRARCHRTEQGHAYGALSQLFDDLPAPVPFTDLPEQEVFHRLYRAIRAVALTGPVVVAIDDVHLADPESARWCSYLARRCDDLPIGLVVTTGSDEPIPDLSALAHTLMLRLDGLCPSCAAALLAPADSAACHRLARGNPQILAALAERLRGQADLPTDIVLATAAPVLADTAMGWLRQDDPVKAHLVEQFAICTAGTLDTAAMLIGQGADLTRAARLTLCRLGLLADGPPDRFAHAAIREAILDRLPPPARAELHIQAAATLSRMGEPAMVAAEHLILVGAIGGSWVQPVLRRAAREATAARDWSRAARFLNRALLEPGDPARTLAITAELGAVQIHHDLAACRQGLTAAADLAPGAAELAGFADAALTMEDVASVGVLLPAGDALAATAGSDRAALLRLAAQALLGGAGLTPAVRQAVRRLPGGPQDVAARQLQSALALTLASQGRNRHATRTLAVRAVGGGPARAAEPVASTTACAALALAWAGELRDAADAATQAVEEARWMSSRTGETLALLVRSEVACRMGNLDTALAGARDAVTVSSTARAANLSAAARANLTRILLLRGEPDAGMAEGQEVDGHPFVLGMWWEAQGMAAAAAGRHGQALRHYLECGRHLMAGGLTNPACSAWRSRAVATMLHLGRTWEARTLATHELTLARRWGSPGPLGRALVAAASACDIRHQLDLLAEAIGVLEPTECRLDLARALVRQGAALIAHGQGATARAALERGMDLAHTCRAGSLHAIARRALQSAGGRPREQPGAAELTAAEWRVAELVARGMSNQVVARSLMLSKRTIDTHLGRIYRKLGIAGRAQLREALALLQNPSRPH